MIFVYLAFALIVIAMLCNLAEKINDRIQDRVYEVQVAKNMTPEQYKAMADSYWEKNGDKHGRKD